MILSITPVTSPYPDQISLTFYPEADHLIRKVLLLCTTTALNNKTKDLIKEITNSQLIINQPSDLTYKNQIYSFDED